MVIDAIYYAVFYLLGAAPKVRRIDRLKFANLTDDLGPKIVELDNQTFDVSDVNQFHIVNSVDNNYYMTCKITEHGKENN